MTDWDRLNYWTSRFPARRVISSYVVGVFLLAFVPAILSHFGAGDSAGLAQAPMAYALVEMCAALIAVILVLFAGGRAAMNRDFEALVLAAVMLLVFGLDLAHALSLARPGAPEAAALSLWSMSRLTLGAGLLVGLLALGRRNARWGLALACLAVLGLAVITAAAFNAPGSTVEGLLRSDAMIARPADFVALLLLVAAGVTSWVRFQRGESTLLGLGVALATVPHAIGQLEVALAPGNAFDSAVLLALFEKLVAYIAMLGGVLLDYLASLRQGATAQLGLQSVREHLTQQTMELKATGEELARQTEQRRQAERTLRMLKNAVETMSIGVTITGTDGKIIYVNPAEARMHGYQVDELTGQNGRIFAAGFEQDSPPPEMLEEDRPWTRERFNRTKAGRMFPVRLVSSWVNNDQAQREGLVTLCEDISDRRRSEEALERRERILEAVGLAAERFLSGSAWETSVAEVLERLGQATGVDLVSMTSLRIEGRPGNSGFNYRWLAPGYSRRHLDVTNWRSIVQRAVFARWPERLSGQRVISGKVSELPANERLILDARSIQSFAAVAIAVDDGLRGFLSLESTDSGRTWSTAEIEALRAAARALGAALERQEAERRLASSEAKYRTLLESANDLIQSVTPDGRFEFVNRAWLAALGYRPEEVERLAVWDVIHPRFHSHCEEMLRRVMAGDPTQRIEVVFVTKSGVEMAVEGNVTNRTDGGRIAATLGIFRDISERVKIDRIKGEFISTVSHELRTPLTSIIAALGLLQSGKLAEQPSRIRELLDVAHRNSLRLLQLINDLLDLQKLAAGKMAFDMRPVIVRPVLQEAVKGMQAFADTRQVRVLLGGVEPDLRAFADEARLIQVLNNLISNAIKFSPVGGEVVLEAEREAARISISVRDQGPGIPREFQQRLFDQFTQLDSSATRSSGGSGLGLSIVKRLVEAMAGVVTCESELGAGATFTIELPRAATDGEALSTTAARLLRSERGFAETTPEAADQSGPAASVNLPPE